MEEATLSQENLNKMLDDQQDVDIGVQPEITEQEDRDPDDWKTMKCRSKVTERIQEEIMRTASQVPKSGAYLEEFVFSRATSRKQYMDLVAGVVIYVAQYNSKMDKTEETEESVKDDASETVKDDDSESVKVVSDS